MRMIAVVAAVLVSAAVAGADTAACPHAAGALPAATLPAGTPTGDRIPIDTIVVLMQENRSFDHYFGFGRLLRQSLRQRRADGDAQKTAANPDPTNPGGPPIRPFHQERLCEVADLNHSWNGTHRSWNGGAMDGFTTQNATPADPSGSRAMDYHTRDDIPFYYALYRKFATGDRYFSSVLGPTFPNRFYLLAATSFGHIRNDLPVDFATDFAQRSIFNVLDEAGITWKVYYAQIPFAFEFAYVRNQRLANTVPIAQYFVDAAAGTLPQVSFVDPIFSGPDENDEHPPGNVQIGQAFVAPIIRALIASPQWPSSALFLTYDEHGGYFDHVPPPAACVPDDVPPQLRPGDDVYAFDRYGIRVPVVVVSPWARKKFVSHVVHDHTSILRFIETRFELPALTRRDANADPMLEFFDFSRPAFRKPPRLPDAVIDPARAALCAGSPQGAFVQTP